MSDSIEDLVPEHLQKRTQIAQRSLADDAWREFERGAAAGGDREAEAGLSGLITGQPKRRTPGQIAGRVGANVAEFGSLRQWGGGVVDAATELGHTARDFNTWASESLSPILGAGIIVDENGIRLASGEEIKATPTLFDALLPEVAAPKTGGGKAARAVSKFLTGFLATKKVPGISKLGAFGSASARGALTDFALFDPHQERLSNLLQKVPALRNPVTEYLAADPTDSAMEGRFKNALEGLGLGTLTEGLFRGVRMVREARSAARMAAPAEETAESAAKSIIAESDTQRLRLVELLGDPEDALVSVKKGPLAADRPAADLAEKLAGATPDDAREVYINWSRIDSPDDVKSVMQKMADTFGEEVRAGQRGVRSWQATKLSAQQVNAWESIANRRAGEAFNAETATAARELWVRSSTKLHSLARIVATGDGSDAARIAFEKQIGIHRVIQREVIGARTETARALNAWKIPVTGGVDGAIGLEQMKLLLDQGGSSKALAAKLVSLGERGMLDKAEAMIEPSFWAKSADAVRQLYYASLLSNPMTHARVAVSNVATLGQTVATRKSANLLGKALGGGAIPDGEAGAGLFAMQQGVRDALRISADGVDVLREASKRALAGDLDGSRAVFGGTADEFGAFYRSLATGETGIMRGAPEGAKAGAFSPEVWGLGRDSVVGRIFDWIDTATRLPGRALGASDEVFGGAAFRAEIAMRAFRQADAELKAGEIAADAFQARLRDLTHNPDEVAKLAATTLSEQVAMRAAPEAGSWSWKLLNSINRIPVFGKLVMPFPRTAYNVGHFQFQYTPLAPLVKEWRDDIAKGGAEAQIAWSKMLMGSALLATFTDFALEGKIIGSGGGDQKLRANREAQDIQAQSIRVGDETFSIRGFGPLSELMGLAANFADIIRTADWEDEDKELIDVIWASALAVGQQVLTAQFMRGASDLVMALSDPQRGKAFAQNALGALVPGTVAYGARVSDPTMREAFKLTDGIRRKYQSDALAPRRDRWGRVLTYSSGHGTFVDAVNPFYAKQVHTDPIDAELDRLETGITKPSRRTSILGVPLDLGRYPEAYSRYVQLAGEPALAHLNALVTGKPLEGVVDAYDIESYRGLTDGPEGGKAMAIENVVNAYREAARVQLYQELPEIKARVDAGIAEKATNLGVEP